MANRQVVLRKRPRDVAQASDFDIVTGAIVDPSKGEVAVRNAFLSVEPAMHGWIADVGNHGRKVSDHLTRWIRAPAEHPLVATLFFYPPNCQIYSSFTPAKHDAG